MQLFAQLFAQLTAIAVAAKAKGLAVQKIAAAAIMSRKNLRQKK
jgi:hypothetical protein